MADFDQFPFDPTAFMSGQIESKIWLCHRLEPILNEKFDRATVIWLLGGWYGMTGFLLQTRQRTLIAQIKSIDLDPNAHRGALILNEAFDYRTTFKAEIADANTISYAELPDVVINTSTEHMTGTDWFDIIPDGTLCVFQSNDMPHDDHHIVCENADHLKTLYPLKETLFLGSKYFHYPDWSFTRYMHIGIK